MEASPCAPHAPPRHVPKRAPAPVARAPPPVNLFESLLQHCRELAKGPVEVVLRLLHTLSMHAQEAVLAAASRVCPRLTHKLRVSEADGPKVEVLPLSQPVVFPLSLQHMDYLADSFAELRAELQLLSCAVDEIKTLVREIQHSGNERDRELARRRLLRPKTSTE